MTNRNLSEYIAKNWNQYKKTITEVSLDSSTNESLVPSDIELICFDDVVGDTSASVDGILLHRNNVYLIEFKKGFSEKITKENFDPERAKCLRLSPPQLCTDYWNVFSKLRKKEQSELLDSLRIKALESYLYLEKQVLPLCSGLANGNEKIRFLVVIDSEPSSAEVDIMMSLAKRHSKANTPFQNVRNALKRLHKKTDASGNDYFYDEIKVFSPQEFLNWISAL